MRRNPEIKKVNKVDKPVDQQENWEIYKKLLKIK